MSASKVLPRLREQVANAMALLDEQHVLTDDEHDAWRLQTEHWLLEGLGEADHRVSAVMNAGSQRIRDSRWSEREVNRYLRGLLNPSVKQLNAVISTLEHQAKADEEKAAETTAPTTIEISRASSKKVFVVHGHDDSAREAIARFIEKLKLEAIILHEQPNRGMTIIEKFEAHAAEVAYAIVLLTPDDRGGTAAAKYEDQRLRARQNVIFELGYFFGALGRGRVCALHKGGIEAPSDFSGVLYVSMDPNDGWKWQVAREIKQVIPTVDVNEAL